MPKSRTRTRKTRPRPVPCDFDQVLAVEVCLDGCCPPRLHRPGALPLVPARLPRRGPRVDHGPDIKHEAPPLAGGEASTTPDLWGVVGGCGNECR